MKTRILAFVTALFLITTGFSRGDTTCFGTGCGGAGGVGDVVSTGNNTFSGTNEFDGVTNFDGAVDFDGATDFSAANVFSASTVFGTAAAAANSVELNETAGCITFEGSGADANESRLCVTNPNADRTMSLPNGGTAFMMSDAASTVTASHVFQSGIYYWAPVEAVTVTKTTTGAEGNETYTNTGDTDGSAITLIDNPSAGQAWHFAVTAAQTVTIVPSAGESLYLAADQCVVSITSNTIGSTLTIRAVVGGSGGVFMTFGASGTWVCNDV